MAKQSAEKKKRITITLFLVEQASDDCPAKEPEETQETNRRKGCGGEEQDSEVSRSSLN